MRFRVGDCCWLRNRSVVVENFFFSLALVPFEVIRFPLRVCGKWKIQNSNFPDWFECLNVWMFIGDEKFHAWMGSSLFSHRARWTAKPSKQNSFSFRLRAEMCEASLDRTEIKSHKLCEKLGSVGLSLSLLQLMSCLLQFLLPFYVFFSFLFLWQITSDMKTEISQQLFASFFLATNRWLVCCYAKRLF